MDVTYVIAHDIGTSTHKCSLVALGDTAELMVSKINHYDLEVSSESGYVEQDPNDWWKAICKGSIEVLNETGVDKSRIKAIVFCAQMQGFVPVDKEGKHLRQAINFLDGRANAQIERNLYKGLIKINGWNAYKTLRSLYISGGLNATPKDPLWKYHWMRDNEPDKFERMYKWLDVKDYIIQRCTGRFCCTMDSANLTFLFDTRKGKYKWDNGLCSLFGVDSNHLPEVVHASDIAGTLTANAAAEMGLLEGTPVIAGGGDASLIPIGAGCTEVEQIHIYIGTSGWVSSVQQRRKLDIDNFIASIVGAIPEHYNYIAEQETAGICLQWVKDNLLRLDSNEDLSYRESDAIFKSEQFYQYLEKCLENTAPGADGILFTPWLQGNRAPREDNFARGMFFNIHLQTSKMEMIRAVMEGVAFHMRWMLEAMEQKTARHSVIRLIGGGATPAWGQILADVTGRTIEIVANPQSGGTIGAALVAGVGLGIYPSLGSVGKRIQITHRLQARTEFRETYDRSFKAFKMLYDGNKKIFRGLNA
ncbi:MAG: FGGY-family carbohydrate kinase [Bacteroidota bacterium]